VAIVQPEPDAVEEDDGPEPDVTDPAEDAGV
jgi:hypothetical protein